LKDKESLSNQHVTRSGINTTPISSFIKSIRPSPQSSIKDSIDLETPLAAKRVPYQSPINHIRLTQIETPTISIIDNDEEVDSENIKILKKSRFVKKLKKHVYKKRGTGIKFIVFIYYDCRLIVMLKHRLGVWRVMTGEVELFLLPNNKRVF
jgi:hypothetical protein